jgi:hypothetical protein
VLLLYLPQELNAVGTDIGWQFLREAVAFQQSAAWLQKGLVKYVYGDAMVECSRRAIEVLIEVLMDELENQL